jgi:hypothetical protein
MNIRITSEHLRTCMLYIIGGFCENANKSSFLVDCLKVAGGVPRRILKFTSQSLLAHSQRSEFDRLPKIRKVER